MSVLAGNFLGVSVLAGSFLGVSILPGNFLGVCVLPGSFLVVSPLPIQCVSILQRLRMATSMVLPLFLPHLHNFGLCTSFLASSSHPPEE